MAVSEKIAFAKALPVWENGKEKEKNHTLAFRCVVDKSKEYTLKIAGHNVYRILINGNFYASGPARTAHGFYRVSEYSITENNLLDGENIISIIVCGYNVNSFEYADASSFLCAELLMNNDVLFATGSEKDFQCINFSDKIQKVQRYSFQRPFTEQYSFGKNYDAFFVNANDNFQSVDLKIQENKIFIERGVSYCEYNIIEPVRIVNRGVVSKALNPKRCTDRHITGINDKLQGFKEDEVNGGIVNEWYTYSTEITSEAEEKYETTTIPSDGSAVFDMGINTTGYIHLSLEAEQDCEIYAIFDEYIDGGVPDGGRNGTANIIKWCFKGGRSYDVVSIEPYTYRFIQIVSLNAPVVLTNVSQFRETYKESAVTNLKKMPNENLQKIYDAAVETFKQNATDIFMDCPSRERAGWLCDSFFTSRTEFELTGKSLVERNFLENFLLPDSFSNIPDGMLPMCYPSDHTDGTYIHNWAMWYVLELKEYLSRTGDTELIEKAKNRVYKLLDFTMTFENEDGFLSKLKSWVFIEWSKANEFVQDINYPTNMLYAKFLETIGTLYDDKKLIIKADILRKKINDVAFDGEFFHDNSEYDESGKAVLTDNITETCQYYAFFTKTATKETHPELFNKLVNEFGPNRKTTNAYPEIYESNAFIGNYLRLDILYNNGYADNVVKEIEDFFLPMAERTGTLWENMSDCASCDHGFASYVAVILNKTVR